MGFLLSFMLLLVIGAIAAFHFKAGLWSILIMFFNIVMAALLATNFWEPLASFLTGSAPSLVYVWDLLALWGIFAASYFVLKAFTDRISKIRVKFPKSVDMLGSMLMLTLVGWVVVCFTVFTLHTAPLSRNFMGGGFTPEKPLFFGVLYPDRLWLGFVQGQSLGGLGRGGTAGNPEAHVFDPRSEYMVKYAARREKFESLKGLFVGGEQ